MELAPTRAFSWMKVPTNIKDTMLNRRLNMVSRLQIGMTSALAFSVNLREPSFNLCLKL